LPSKRSFFLLDDILASADQPPVLAFPKVMPLPPPPVGYETRMPRHTEASGLRVVGQNVFGREVQLAPEAAEAWLAMQRSAEKEAVHLLLLSGFRSIERQAEIVRKKIEAGLTIESILRVNAYPGFSEHHTGRAIDLGSPDCTHFSEDFEATREFAWLKNHASQYGFFLSYPRANRHEIIYEPWHWNLRT
jgi:zinc D-Ala-D-Ala carboxypeptidase